MAAAVPENAPTAQNLIPLPVRQLYENHPSALRGDNLVRAAEYYTIEELLLQANKKIPTEKNTLAKYLSKAIGDLAIRNGSEPDLYRDAFDSCRATNWIARLGNSGAATRLLNKSCIMPASVATLTPTPNLQELAVAYAAYDQKRPAGYRFPSEYWVKLRVAIQNLHLEPKDLEAAFGYKNYRSALNHHVTAVDRGRLLTPILANLAAAPPMMSANNTVMPPPASSTTAPTNGATLPLPSAPQTAPPTNGNPTAPPAPPTASAPNTTTSAISVGTANPASKKRGATSGSRSTGRKKVKTTPQATSGGQQPGFSAPPASSAAVPTYGGSVPASSLVLPSAQLLPSPRSPPKVRKISDGVRTALLTRVNNLQATPRRFNALTVSSLTDLMVPLSDSGEIKATIAAYKDYCRDFGAGMYGQLKMAAYVAFAIHAWVIISSEYGTFLDFMQEALELIDDGMVEMKRDKRWHA